MDTGWPGPAAVLGGEGERQQLTRAGNCWACQHRQVAATQLVHVRLSFPCGDRNHPTSVLSGAGREESLRNSALEYGTLPWMIPGLSPLGRGEQLAQTDPVYPDAHSAASP